MNAALISELPPPLPAKPPVVASRRRWLIRGGLFLVVAAIGAGVWSSLSEEAPASWKTSPVVRTDLLQTVSSTGTLEAVTTVDVGTQVSGRVTQLLVDFNDDVKAGQLLAQIDPTLLSAEVDSARAGLAQQQATAVLAAQELERVEFLTEHEASSLKELQVAQASASEAAARVTSARVALERAQRNLAYAAIVSPIDGTVVDRLVEVGQTVNAGTATPTLYTLAGDLEEMQILATVDEADIGLVSPGQSTTFTVQAWPERTFEGTVRQVRLQSTTTDSVVTYTAVVDVSNSDRLLRPGMTANVDFVVASAAGALSVPAAALRFKPGSGASRPGSGASRPRSGERRSGSGERRPGSGERRSGSAESRPRSGGGRPGQAVWTTDEAGAPHRVAVEVGLSDGRFTQVSGQGVVEGLTVITGRQTGGSADGGSSSPFQGGQLAQPGPGGGRF
jgi:HlyD family secretion protein